VETHVSEISRRLVERGFEVKVLTTDPSGKLPRMEVADGVAVRRFRSWAPGDAYYFSSGLRNWLGANSGRYDIVHAHNYHALPALYATRFKDGSKLVFTPHYHGAGHTYFRNLLHIPYRHISRRIFERADLIICVSQHEEELLMRNFTIERTKLRLIPNGVNLQEFAGTQKSGRKVVLCVGRLERYKGIDYLIEALPRLSDEVRLEIVGEGPHRNALMKLARQVRAEGRVSFLGNLPRNELVQKYREAGLFALISRYEAYCISVAEALAAKTPCIVAETSALREWIDNRNCFGISYPINIQQLALMIDSIMGRSIGPIRLPTWDETVEKLVLVYQDSMDA